MPPRGTSLTGSSLLGLRTSVNSLEAARIRKTRAGTKPKNLSTSARGVKVTHVLLKRRVKSSVRQSAPGPNDQSLSQIWGMRMECWGSSHDEEE